MSDAPPPVFVDDTGRRRILTRRAGRIVVLGFTGYLGLVALGFARDPGVGPVHLPTFGLPSLGLVVPPAPSVLGEQATRTVADAQPVEGEQATAPTGPPERRATSPGTPLNLGTTALRPTAPAAMTPAGSAASRATAPAAGLPASSSSTTTTAPSTSTTSGPSSTTTTTTTMPGPGQGQAQRSDAASTKGPDGSGPPGQQRKTTTG